MLDHVEVWMYCLVLVVLLFGKYSSKLKVAPPVRRVITMKPKVYQSKKKDDLEWRRSVLILPKTIVADLSPVQDGLRAPPNSPVHEVYLTPEPYVEPYVVEPYVVEHDYEEVYEDKDSIRRRSYIRKQVTDGEVMMQIDEWSICLIFVNGIEYHYVKNGDETFWDIPDCLHAKCKSWYLTLPKHKQRKLKYPPKPIEHKILEPILYY